MEIQKFEYLENEKNFVDEIRYCHKGEFVDITIFGFSLI